PPSVERKHPHARRRYWPPWLAAEEAVHVDHLREHQDATSGPGDRLCLCRRCKGGPEGNQGVPQSTRKGIIGPTPPVRWPGYGLFGGSLHLCRLYAAYQDRRPPVGLRLPA